MNSRGFIGLENSLEIEEKVTWAFREDYYPWKGLTGHTYEKSKMLWITATKRTSVERGVSYEWVASVTSMYGRNGRVASYSGGTMDRADVRPIRALFEQMGWEYPDD